MATEPSLFGLDGLGVGSAEAILISAFIGGLVALIVVAQHRITAKKEKAYKVSQDFMRPEIDVFEAKLIEVSENNSWGTIFGSQQHTDEDARQKISSLLNEWELICVAIRQNIADEGVLKDVIGDRLVFNYRRVWPLIQKIRDSKNDDEFFEHFEYIANRWKANPKNLRRNRLRVLLSEIVRI